MAVSRMGAVAEKLEDLKMLKYLSLDSSYLFMPVAVETCTVCPKTKSFIQDLGHRLKIATEDRNSFQYLIQRISIKAHRGSANSILGTIEQLIGLLDD